MALEREKVLNWWVGRITDQELADWSGLPIRTIRMILDLPVIKDGVVGGGRGSRNTRRITPVSRNLVGIVAAMVEAGLSLELAGNLARQFRLIAEEMNVGIDQVELGDVFIHLDEFDPKGGWLAIDRVPTRIWGRYVIWCREIDDPEMTKGVIGRLPEDFSQDRKTIEVDRLKMFVDGGLSEDRARELLKEMNLTPVTELIPVSDELSYDGEYDPFGMNRPNAGVVPAFPHGDDHLLIADGRYVFHRYPIQRPFGVSSRKFSRILSEEPNLSTEPHGIIQEDGKTVSRIARDKAEKAQKLLNSRTKFFKTLLDINLTYTVRQMKRRALGLPVS